VEAVDLQQAEIIGGDGERRQQGEAAEDQAQGAQLGLPIEARTVGLTLTSGALTIG
jgi:hypothetical protein